jgi:riboflavin kinase/FMN adenylyltransferase
VKVLLGLESIAEPIKRSVLMIGNFDGVHCAHVQLITQACLFADVTGGAVVALTFEPHPVSILRPTQAPKRLTTLERKLELLARCGVDITVVARTDRALLSMEAEPFIEDVVIRLFWPTHIVEGPTFAFGRGRRGTPELLMQMAAVYGCELHVLEPVRFRFEANTTSIVSSTLIRRLLDEGHVRRAALCLGRPHSVEGTVVTGARRGRGLGFPTANLTPEGQLVPAVGVYAGVVECTEGRFAAAVNVGPAPTFLSRVHLVEAHLLGFDGDLYDRSIRVEFHHRLRDQQTFESPEALARQLVSDVEAVRSRLDALLGRIKRESPA